jgi:hypothetical protein
MRAFFQRRFTPTPYPAYFVLFYPKLLHMKNVMREPTG